jgi:hypothetical protein
VHIKSTKSVHVLDGNSPTMERSSNQSVAATI